MANKECNCKVIFWEVVSSQLQFHRGRLLVTCATIYLNPVEAKITLTPKTSRHIRYSMGACSASIMPTLPIV